METHNRLKKDVQRLYQEIEKNQDTPHLRQEMARLSQSEHLTAGQRGALNYYSNPNVPMDQQAQADFKQLIYDLDTRTNIMIGDVLGQMKSLEPMIQFKKQGYTWGINFSDLGQIRLDKQTYGTIQEAQAQADTFTDQLGQNLLKPWITLGMGYWIGTKNLSTLQPFRCRAEILNIRGKQFLILYELWDRVNDPSIKRFQQNRTAHFTKRVQQLQGTTLFPQWALRGFVPYLKEQGYVDQPSAPLGMFYVGYSFMNTDSIDVYEFSKKMQTILCE